MKTEDQSSGPLPSHETKAGEASPASAPEAHPSIEFVRQLRCSKVSEEVRKLACIILPLSESSRLDKATELIQQFADTLLAAERARADKAEHRIASLQSAFDILKEQFDIQRARADAAERKVHDLQLGVHSLQDSYDCACKTEQLHLRRIAELERGRVISIPVKRENGWTVDTDFLETIHSEAEQFDDSHIYPETIEAVILALAKLGYAKLEDAAMSKEAK